ncbi:3-deoxy-D-arabinoheptulosonate-7-phosphate synthase [Saccharopolyspora erythraea NRRL 2338]|nr:3-deoxy-7-phosphoheptulonate synthase class II [Saccharopolyspora erythraea]EQD82701.1 phospho-2-dehydro-3-deoxyheptonate aldolase [Saccharopolyspora erythraea D]PFG97084.1 3-deoxy-D-arabinoheptulosonate-7-phosphate synthase [Saccharopolyspora erythraea NRRL 2338]QRK87294.1 3-deoxy-7-phosphoheptulonate synthase class II [Saccharopolyspora erythraea]
MTVADSHLAAELDAESWRSMPAAQQPDWPDPVGLRRVVDELRAAPPLVFPSECDRLRSRLAVVARGGGFLLQGGDCAETFDGVSPAQVRAKLRTLAQMALVIGYACAAPVVKVGRIAGQYSKPRSSPTETRDGRTLPSYRGDSVNGPEFGEQARTPDPERLLRMYHSSMATLNVLRAFGGGGRSDLRRVHGWNEEFVSASPSGKHYQRLWEEIGAALGFMRSLGAAPETVGETEFFTSHEALVLEYESALTHGGGRPGEAYDLSGHMVWIGERTRRIDGAHVEFASRIRNPIGIKLSAAAEPDEVLALIDKLDPHREPGRLTLITRMGAQRVRAELPALVEKVTAAGAPVVWVCDPMHGNTFEAANGYKTRRFDDVLDELRGFLEVHRALGTHPGGVHLELTGDDVTECLGGGDDIGPDDLPERYRTACDPRLNRSQALDLAFRLAEMYRGA